MLKEAIYLKAHMSLLDKLCEEETLKLIGGDSFVCVCKYHVFSKDVKKHLNSKHHIQNCIKCNCGKSFHIDEHKKHKQSIHHIKCTTEKKCHICYELKSKFWTCSQCLNGHCIECNSKILNTKCPFCRNKYGWFGGVCKFTPIFLPDSFDI